MFQATFVVLSRQASRVRRPEALAGFLHTVAVRLARKARAAKRRRQQMQTNGEIPELIDPRPHPLDVISGRELLALLDEEIARLPERYRVPLVLCLLQGRTVEEAARQLGWSIGSFRGRLTRGRERLRKRLMRRGLDLSVGAVALLTPVAVPEKLLAESLRHLDGPVSAGVSALASGMMPAVKAKIVGLALILVATVGLGAGLTLRSTPEPQTPAASVPAAPQPQAKSEPRRDRYGDTLPPGAITRLGTLRFRAPDEIQALTFAPDNKTLLVSSRGGLLLFDAFSGKRLRRLPSSGPSWRPDELLAFSAGGKQLIGRGEKITGSSAVPVVRVWEMAGGRQTQEHEIGPWILWVGWSSEGHPLALRIDDKEDKGSLHLHDLFAGKARRFACAKPCKNPAGEIHIDPPFSFSPRKHALALADEEGTIHIWDTTTGRESRTLQPKGNGIYSLTFSPDGGRLMIRTAKDLQMWDAIEGKILYTVSTANVIYGPLAFSADGKTLAIIKSWQTICFWDAATGKERGHTQENYDLAAWFALSPDGKWLATARQHGGGTFHVWDAATGKKQAEPVGHLGQPYGTAFAPEGRRVATGGGTDGTLRLWDCRSGEQLLCIKQPGMTRRCAFSEDGKTLWASWSYGGLGLYDAATGQQRHVIKLEDPDQPDTYQSVISTYQSRDSKKLIALSYYYERKTNRMRNATLITGWDTSTRKELFRRRRSGMDSWVALSPDARVLAVPHPGDPRGKPEIPGKGPIRLEDAATGELVLTFPIQEGQTWPLAFSPDGRLLISNNSNNKRTIKDGQSKAMLQLWETATAAEVLSLPGADINNRVAFSPDGRLLALTGAAQQIRIYDLARRREQQRFQGFDAAVTWLAFSPDGQRLISGLSDSTLLIWEVAAPAPPGKLDAVSAARAWDDLSGNDAARAFRARGALAAAPDAALPLLTKRLHPAQPADPQRLRRLLTDLESEQFAVRDKAQKELENLGDLAEQALRQTLAHKPTLEVRRRVQTVLERLHGPLTRPELLQALRAVAVLEDIGTPEARRLLKELAQGAPEARLTREARESLRRIASRS